MGKLAPTTHAVHPLIQKRYSPLAFADRPVEDALLLQLFEAARWAPSSYNEQPWSFVYGKQGEGEGFAKIFDCLVEANQQWAAQAPVLVMSIASLNFSKNQKPNRHAYHDVGLAMGNFLLQATELGLYVHQMAGFSEERARENLHIPEGYDPVAAIAIGYLGDVSTLGEPLQKREQAERVRKPLEDFVYKREWGRT